MHSRRDLLGATALLSCALAAPAPLAAAHPLAGPLRQARQDWLYAERELQGELLPDGALPEDPALRRAIDQLSRGLGGLRALEGLRALPLRDQVHREVQGLIAEIAVATSRAVDAAEALLSAHLERPEAEGLLRGGARALRRRVQSWSLSPERAAQLEGLLEGLAGEPEQLRAQLRRLRRRRDKGRRLAAQVVQDPRGLATLEQPTPELQAAVSSGEVEWAEEAQPLSKRLTGLVPPASQEFLYLVELTFGLMALGTMICCGFVFIVMGVCGYLSWVLPLACVALILLGVLCLGIGLWGAVSVTKANLRRFDAPPPRLLRAFAPKERRGRLPAVEEASLPLQPDEGWVSVGLRAHPGRAAQVALWGRLLGPWGWSSPLEEDAPAGLGAPCPSAPVGGLLVRVGGRRVELDASGRLPEGAEGPMELALNLSPAQAAEARGFIYARVTA